MSSRKPAKRESKATSGFEFGARVLGTTVEGIRAIYHDTIHVLEQGIITGKTNAPMGLMSLLVYFALLHGGSYAAPINKIPYYMKDPTKSPYYGGDLDHLPGPGVAGFFATALAGVNASDLAIETITNANVPHVFPKLLDDQTFAITKILYAQAATTDLFKSASTGVKTLVEGVSGGFEPFLEAGATRERRKSRDEMFESRLNAVLGLSGQLAEG